MVFTNDNTYLWEDDFLKQDLFCTQENNIDVIYLSQILNWENNPKIFSDITEKYKKIIFVFTSNKFGFEKILEIIKILSPIITVHLSDEWGVKPQFQELAKYTKLLLRQYSHTQYKNYKNIKYIPLGYMNGIVNDNTNYVLPSNRKHTWSFIGNLKQDRQIMIEKMKKIEGHCVGKCDKNDMIKIYKNSIFVPNGRGNMSLNCFRLYEASMCGAIPIVVGDKKEIEATFLYEENPPWIFCKSWDDAVEKCQKLLKNKERLDEMSLDVIKWWDNRIKNIKEIIKKHIF